ncbi:14087_t:CDS:1, partial [Ambispora leptoticha]
MSAGRYPMSKHLIGRFMDNVRRTLPPLDMDADVWSSLVHIRVCVY